MQSIVAKLDKDREILQKLANSVAKVMHRRSWTVQIFTELDPKRHPNLLGLNYNRGQKIQVRLKGTNGIYLQWHDLIGTTLHELVHNKFGPHDAKFYKLLDEIYTEWERDDAGILVPFSGAGQVLGGRQLTPMEAAIKRAQQPQRLGGADHRGDPRQLAALAALDRRKRLDDQQCGGRGEPIVIDLTQSSDDDDEDWQCKMCTLINRASSKRCIVCDTIK